ncbi:M20 aminoacylase family protein [Tropicibacter oceani]|uniref:M20 aminoacylase family protein n=1 Tax=Tropicibacter oceani TaxID=3058420 RepID=A0ABY8QEQ2_9RHOB|nr:M20 aminoacylase family protein [Tropicibacter oceani]WGW02481.1 M20 aminoacylase family protein [Tropicibacter oceani]
MPVLNSIADMADDMKTWRRYLHQHPELGLECHETAKFVVERLKGFGITDIHTGIATSGVVAVIEGRGPGRTIGLRADMDALPMEDLSGTDHASTVPGVAHTCGHDGHTTMLLGAAKYLAETRNFAGRVALIFQPAEEGEGGGRIMVEEGMMERFGIDEVYGIHNMPGGEVGHMHTGPGPLMAGVDTFYIDVQGVGGHGAMPYQAKDPVMAAVAIVQALQTIVSRNINALDALVITVTQIHADGGTNIIPDTARIVGTLRYFDKEVQALARARMAEIVEFQPRAFGQSATLRYEEGYPPTINHADQAAFAAQVAREVVGAGKVEDNCQPIMAAEDFAYMLEARPGAYLFLGQGDTPVCHHPRYDFNDDIAPVGASFFATLVERALPL